VNALPPVAQAGWAWFLDVDGTLADFADAPDRVTIHADVMRILHTLHAYAGGAVALVSGRPIRDIDRLFGGSIMAVAGQHGNERRSASGEITYGAVRDERMERAIAELMTFSVHVPELIVEDKGISATIHYRNAPELESLVDSVVEDVHSRMGAGFLVQGGKMLREIVPIACDKGTAVSAFMGEAPFRGRAPAFVGDDVTDEHAFMVVNRLGGHSIKVGPGETIARHRLENVEAVRTWLARTQPQVATARAAGE
jgi:trehalose 6-phosphate phosphatase